MPDLKALIKQGEGISVEFKECRHTLNREAYKTVCAFLNRHGGTILLGVKDNGEISGIDPDVVVQLRKDFITAINNPQKIAPPTYLSVDEIQMEDKTVFRVYVPESSQVHRCNGRIYDRNEDGDLDITDHTAQVARLYQRKQATYSENKVYPHVQVEDLRRDLIEKCRKIARVNTQNHPWATMDDLHLLQSAQLCQTDQLTRENGVTLAGIMMFAPDQIILNVCPAHRTDLILRKVNVDRYDDRDLVRTNLIDSYDRILAFVQKHLPDPFYLDGIERISLRDIIFREVASNMLIHREYVSGIPARLIIEYGRVTTENANRPHGFGTLNLATFTPFPKNPVLGAFFREIHRADELGSGMRKLIKYGKAYGGADPELIEGDIFRTIVKYPDFEARQTSSTELRPEIEARSGAPGAGGAGTKLALSRHQVDIMHKCSEDSRLVDIMAITGRSDRTKFRHQVLNPLLKGGLIEMTIPDKPRSSKQKYRLTARGKKLLKSMQNKALKAQTQP